jgi:pimeloyl-ACP methyl ester carboxylesterase
VFLHEGLGSIAMWRDFPSRAAHASGCNALVYSRHGYGNSTPLASPRGVLYMHDEARNALPELLDKLGIERPVLVGHSDGASIALIHAGHKRAFIGGVGAHGAARHGRRHLGGQHRRGEDRLRDHRPSRETCALSRRCRFRLLGLEPDLAASRFPQVDYRGISTRDHRVPVLAIQGEDDEYGTIEQLHRIGREVRDVELLELKDCRHSPHRDQPEAVLEAITRFVDRITA